MRPHLALGFTLALLLLLTGPSRGQQLLAHYPFDAQTGSDASGNNNHAALRGGVTATTDRFGQPCSALHFNGLDGYLEAPASPTLQSPSHQLTVAVWCRLEPTAPDAARWLTLICKGDGPEETADNPQYRAQILQAPTLQQSTVSINSELTEYDDLFTTHPFPSSSWFFYVLTFDGSAVRSYQNGVEIFAYPYLGSFLKNDSPLFIGRDAPGQLEFFKGDLDDLRLYGQALTPAQIQGLYRAGSVKGAGTDFTLECPAPRTVAATLGQCSAIVTFGLPRATSACGPITVRQLGGPRSGEAFPVGTTTLTFQAETAQGLKKTCYARVKVMDQEAPKIAPLTDTTLQATTADPTGVNWRFSLPAASDNCSQATLQVAGALQPGARFALGRSELVFIATDVAGNRSEARRTVTVLAPVTPNQATAATPPAPKRAPQATLTKGDRSVKPDSIKPGPTLKFNGCIITILAYDGYAEDGDSISIFFNQKEIEAKQMIRNKENKPIVHAIMLNPGEKNALVVKAWNVGRPGTPNTLKVEFFEGYFTEQDVKKLRHKKPVFTKTMYAAPGISDSIYLTCKN